MPEPGNPLNYNYTVKPLFREEVYTDGGPCRILMRVPMPGTGETTPAHGTEFIGFLPVQDAYGNVAEIQFLIPAATLTDARSLYKECMKKVFEEVKEKAAQPHIELPGAGAVQHSPRLRR